MTAKKSSKYHPASGEKFNSLTAIEKSKKRGCWIFQCDCGTIKAIRTGKVVNSRIKSCGCRATKKSNIDISPGYTFHYWTAVEPIGNGFGEWLFCCQCGKTRVFKVHQIVSKDSKSCGCLNYKSTKDPNVKTSNPLYVIYKNMIRRCYDKNDSAFQNYGGRGIYVCQRWLDSFWNFVDDMGERPDGYSMDRINNDGPYSPSNTQWSTYKQQCRNKSNNRFLTHDGKTLCHIEWEEITGISRATIQRRIDKYRWCIPCALTLPVRQKRKGQTCHHR